MTADKKYSESRSALSISYGTSLSVFVTLGPFSAYEITALIMHLQSFFIILSLSSLLGLGGGSAAFGDDYNLVASGRVADHSRPIRSLSAARKVSNIKSRSIEGCLSHDLELHYMEGDAGTAHNLRYPLLTMMPLRIDTSHIRATCLSSAHVHQASYNRT